MIHFNSRQQNHHGFYSFFYALIILLIHCPFSFNKNKGGFFFKTNRGLEKDSPTSAAVYDSLLWCWWRWWQQSFFQLTRTASLFWFFFISISSWYALPLKENGILHHLIDAFLLLSKKKEGLAILIHRNLHHLSDAFFSFPLKQAGVSDLFFASSIWFIFVEFCISIMVHFFLS